MRARTPRRDAAAHPTKSPARAATPSSAAPVALPLVGEIGNTLAPRRRSTRTTPAASTERSGAPIIAIANAASNAESESTTASAPAAAGAAPSPAYRAGSAMRTTSLLMLLQIGSRLLTFVLNVLVARQIGPALYGIANVHFYLVYTTILFVAREGLRRACLRSGSFANPSASASLSSSLPSSSSSSTSSPLHPMRDKLVEIINLVWLCGVPLALVLALALGGLAWAHPPLQDPHYTLSLGLYVASALIEMLGEPLYIASSTLLWVRLRVFIELAAVLVRTAVTAILVLYFRQALLAFAVAQFAYSLWTTASYYAYFATRIVTQTSASQFELSSLADLLPQRLPVHCAESASALILPPPRRAFVRNGELLGLVFAFTVQSSEKLLLTEGEKFVLAGFSTQLEENGVYSLVQNLGSLVARMIFQPLEESSYAEFSNLLGPLTLRSAAATANIAATGQSVADQRKDNDASLVTASRQAVAILATLTKCVTLVGLVFVCFGPPYARVLFDLVYGARWTHTSAPVALSWYCGYVLLMAVNGVTESFLLASIPPASVHAYNVWLAVFSAVYMVASWAALPFGARGLIAANCLNFLIRIVYSAHFIRAFLRRARVLEAEVALKTLAASRKSCDRVDKSASESLLDGRAFLRRIALARGSLAAFALATAGVWVLYAAFSIGSLSLSGLPASASASATDFAPNAGDIRSVTASLNRLSAMMAYTGHIGAGAVLVGMCAFAVWQFERAFIADMRRVFGK